MKKLVLFLGRLGFELVLHSLAAVIIFLAFLPLARWYINHKPILGVDFYNMVANAAYYARHPEPRFLGFRPVNWGGFPYAYDYPSLHFYLISPLVSEFGAQKATLVYTMGAMYIFALSGYFLFWTLSRNVILAAILAILGIYSIGTWGPVVWGGNLQYFATMPLLPLVLGFLMLYLTAKTRKNLMAAAGLTGISALGHPQVMVAYIIPFAAIFLLFGYFAQLKATIGRRLVDLGIFLGSVILIAYIQLQLIFGDSILYFPSNLLINVVKILDKFLGTEKTYGYSVPASTPPETLRAIAQYNRDEFWRFKTEVNEAFFAFVAIAIILLAVGIIIARSRKQFLGVVPYLLLVGFLFGNNFALSRGIGLFQGGWFRVFWPMPIVFGALIALGYNFFWRALVERLRRFGNPILKIILLGVFSCVILGAGYGFFLRTSVATFEDRMENNKLRQKSGAHPEALNQPFNREELENLAQKLVPLWLPVDQKQYRLYTADQKVNIWWPTFYEMPLVRGYIDVPVGSGVAGGFFWTDIALAQNQGRDTLVEDFQTPVEIAQNNALFLIDWYSIEYFEGGHERSDSFTPPASYLIKNNFFDKEELIKIPGYAKVYDTKTNKIEWVDDPAGELKYFKFKEGLASPIASAVNTTVIGFVGTYQSYDTFMRVLGMTNTNSKQLIPLWFGSSLNELPSLDHLNIDGLVLYGYADGNSKKGLSRVEKYLRNGGKVFIETGSDVFQTQNDKLPNFFPISGTKKGEIGDSWDIADFGPPVLDDKPWLFSLPTSVKGNAQVHLKTADIPLVVSADYNSGKVIWSGVNLFFHANVYKNLKEGQIIKDLITNLILLESKQPPSFKADFISNRKVKIETKEAKAVLLRQQAHSGWQAKVNGQKLPIYKTGPTYPGFMYVAIPAKFKNEKVEVEFSYKGDNWTLFYTFLTGGMLILIGDYILGSRLLNLIASKFRKMVGLSVRGWWEKEDE